MKTFQHALTLALTAALCALPACGGSDDSGGDGSSGASTSTSPAASGAAPATDVPHSGRALLEFDWEALFPPGDGWRDHDQVFVFNNGAEPETLDPALMTGVPEHTLALALYEGLTSHHPVTLQPVPGVAAWWEISEDGLVYTFHLRDDAKWSNGDPVTAEDFRWSWIRALDPKTAAQYAYQLWSIKNAKAFTGGEVTDPSEVGIQVVDEHTFVVTLESPTAYFLDLTSFETLMPVHRATVETHGDEWTSPGNIVTNGPFQLAAREPRIAIEMVPNEHYWNRGIVRLERIRALAMDDMNTAYNEYTQGSIDWLKAVPQKRIDEVQLNPDYYAWPYLGTYFFRYNITEPPFDDVRVRMALNLAVNKTSLCVDTLKAGQIPAQAYVPPGIHGYENVEGLAYDPERAKELLAEAGYPNGEGFPDVELVYNTSESHKQVCEVITSMWNDTLGINAKLRNMEWQIYLETVDTMQYQVARAGWIGDYTDPNTFLDMFVTGGGNNNTGFSNAEYDAAIEAAARETDLEKRFEHFRRAEQILCVDELPILPIYYYVNQGLLRPRVRNLHGNIRDLHPFQVIYLDGPPAKK